MVVRVGLLPKENLYTKFPYLHDVIRYKKKIPRTVVYFPDELFCGQIRWIDEKSRSIRCMPNRKEIRIVNF